MTPLRNSLRNTYFKTACQQSLLLKLGRYLSNFFSAAAILSISIASMLLTASSINAMEGSRAETPVLRFLMSGAATTE